MFVWATLNIFEFEAFSLAFDSVIKYSYFFQNPQVSRCSLKATVNSYNILCCLWINVPAERRNRQNASNPSFSSKNGSEAFTLIKRKQTFKKNHSTRAKNLKKWIVWYDRKEKLIWWKLPDLQNSSPSSVWPSASSSHPGCDCMVSCLVEVSVYTESPLPSLGTCPPSCWIPQSAE